MNNNQKGLWFANRTLEKSFLPLLQNCLHGEENSLILAILTCSMETDHSNHIQACPFPKAWSFNLGFLQIRIHRCGDPWQNNKRFDVEQVVWKTWFWQFKISKPQMFLVTINMKNFSLNLKCSNIHHQNPSHYFLST